MMKKLDVCIPPITGFFHIDIPLAILYSDKRTHAWVFSNYIQLYSIENIEVNQPCFIDFYHSYFGAFRFLELATCPWILFERISIKDIKEKWANELIFIKSKIDENKYIGITVLMEKIQNYDGRSGSHNLFIYGYNDEKEVLYCADHFRKGVLSFEEVSYNDFENATTYPCHDELNWGALEGVCMFSKIERSHEKIYDLSINKIIFDLKMYLERETLTIRKDDYFIFGLNCYDNMIYYYKLAIEKLMPEIGLKAIHIQRKHKKIMLLRVEYLAQEYPMLKVFFAPLEKLLIDLELTLNLIIKYNLKRKHAILEKVIDNILAIKENEEQILKEFIKALTILE